MGLQDIGLNAVFRNKDFQGGVKDYQQEVGNAEKVTEKAASRMSGLGDVAKGAAVVGIGAATAGVAAFVAAAKFGVDALNSWNDQVNTLSDNLGTTGEQSAVWAAAFNHVGLTVDEGGAGLNFFTRGLDDLRTALNEGKDLTPFGKALDKLGVSAFDANGDLRTFDQVMPDLLDSFQQMPAGIDKTALAMELFGSRAGTKFIDFLSQGSEGLEHARKMVADFGLGLTTEGSGAIEEFGFAWNDLQLGFQGVMAQIGLALLPTLQTLIAFVTANVLPVLSQWAQLIKPVVDEVVGLGSQFLNFLETGEMFEDFGTEFAAMFGPFEPLVLGVVRAVAKFVDTAQNIVGWATDTFPIAEKIKLIFYELGRLFGLSAQQSNDMANGVKQAIQAIWDFIQPVLANIFNEIGKFWTEIQPRLQKAWDNIYNNIIVPVLTAIVKFISDHQEEIKQIIEGAWQFISGVFQTAWALISGIVKIALDLLGGDMDAAGRDWKALQEGVWEGIQNIFKGAWKAIGQFVFDALVGLVRAIDDKMAEARQGIIDQLNSAVDWLRSLPSRMVQVGIDIVQGLIDGFWQQAGAVQDALKDIVQLAVQGILDSLGLGGLGFASPSLAGAGAGGAGRTVPTSQSFFGAGGGDTTNSALTVIYNGKGGPGSPTEASEQAQWLQSEMQARGLF